MSPSGSTTVELVGGWGVGDLSPPLGDAPPAQPGCPERLREVRPKMGAGVWTRRQSFSLSLSLESDPWIAAGAG